MNSNLTDRLLRNLNNEGLNYCHWKSNVDLAQATSGEMDLDILIDRESYQPALSILSRLGFKAAVVSDGVNPPGISHYYGYDPSIGRFVHVHLFSRVLTGESFLKSHLLPFEAMLFENTRYVGQMRVASKSAELVLFTVRTYIKYGSALDLMVLFKKTEKIKSELGWLQRGSDLNESISLLNQYCPVIDEDLFLECIHQLESDASLFQRVRLAWQVRKRMRIYSKYNLFERIFSTIGLVFTKLQRRLGPKKKNKVLQAGGTVIAIVGLDATGKSTLVEKTGRWLGEIFKVRIIHAGKPPSSWLTAPINLLLKLLHPLRSSLHPDKSGKGRFSAKKNSSRHKIGFKHLLYAFRAVTLAWDRRNLLLKSWRAAAKGEIVICDRYPSSIIGAMDSPRLQGNVEGTGLLTSLYEMAARFERQLYTQVPPPDIAIRLHVSAETAIQRNRQRNKSVEEPDEYIDYRHNHFKAWHRSDTRMHVNVDTEKPLDETWHEIQSIIWRSI